jgi:hypothetical protein
MTAPIWSDFLGGPTRSSRAMSESRSVAGIPRPAIRVLLLKWITLKREIDHFLSIATSGDAAAAALSANVSELAEEIASVIDQTEQQRLASGPRGPFRSPIGRFI